MAVGRTAKDISWHLAIRHSSPFHARRHLAVVPNVSWGLLPWEADILVLHKNHYLTEIEIKISMADWKADLAKPKHRPDIGWKETAMVKRFFYAAPSELASRYAEVGIPESAGVIGITESGQVEVLRDAKDRSGYRKLTDDEVMKVLRLAAIKAWKLSHDPATEAVAWAAGATVQDFPDGGSTGQSGITTETGGKNGM